MMKSPAGSGALGVRLRRLLTVLRIIFPNLTALLADQERTSFPSISTRQNLRLSLSIDHLALALASASCHIDIPRIDRTSGLIPRQIFIACSRTHSYWIAARAHQRWAIPTRQFLRLSNAIEPEIPRSRLQNIVHPISRPSAVHQSMFVNANRIGTVTPRTR
jgi:hypothetical protein